MPKFNIPHVFKEIVSVYTLPDPKYAKPHPKSAELILTKLGYSAEQAVVIGDAANDVKMAQAAGIQPVVVLTGHLTRHQAEELGVEDIIENVLNIESAL